MAICKTFRSVSWEANSSQAAECIPHLIMKTEDLLPRSKRSASDCYHKNSLHSVASLKLNFIRILSCYLRRISQESSLLGAFAQFRKATISFDTSLSPPVRMSVCPRGKIRLHLMGFHGNWCLSIFRKSIEEIQFSFNSNKKKSTLYEDIRTFIIISCSILVTMRNVSDSSVEKIKTSFLCSTTFLQ